jgi:hypothetical protein
MRSYASYIFLKSSGLAFSILKSFCPTLLIKRNRPLHLAPEEVMVMSIKFLPFDNFQSGFRHGESEK